MPTGKICPFISNSEKVANCYDKCEFKFNNKCLIAEYMKSQISFNIRQK